MKITLYPKYLIRRMFAKGKGSFFSQGYECLYPECARHGMTPWQHYVVDGLRKGYDDGNNPPETVFFREGYDVEYPDVEADGIDPWHHYVLHGKKEGRDNGLHPKDDQFFAEGYLVMYPDAASSGLDPWHHYILHGKKEGLDNGNHPLDALFFREGYETEYPDIMDSGVDPWHHYVLQGKKEGRDNGLHPGEDQFFPEGYLAIYPDAAESRQDPWHHYVLAGKKDGRDNGNHPPEALFFREGYETEYPDIKESSLDPWHHYVMLGKGEGRDSGNCPSRDQFFPEGYLEMYADAVDSGEDPWHHYVFKGAQAGHDNGNHPSETLFFQEGYEAEYPDVKSGSAEPWHHYVLHGKKEGRDNGLHPKEELFFSDGYLEMYPDVADAGGDPWRHYVMNGKNEGRDNGWHPGDELFFAAGYLEMYPDVGGSGMDPWRQYVKFGKKAGRDNGLHPQADLFFAEGYLEINPDVAGSGADPWRHYVMSGKNEGRDNGLHPDEQLFFAEGYKFNYPSCADEPYASDLWKNFVLIGKKLKRNNGLTPLAPFFSGCYLEQHPGITDAEAWKLYVLDSIKIPDKILLPYPPESGMPEILRKKNPAVAVVMPVYNRKNLVMHAIESVENQSWINWHLYVVDDFSDDGTYDYLNSVISDSRITLLRSENKGVCGARNTAIAHIKKEDYVAYLDSDNTWNRYYLEQMLCRLMETNTCCCYGALKLLRRKNDGSEEIIRFWYDAFDVNELRCANYIDINVFMHSTDVFHEIGVFDESLRRMVDWDFILRCAEKYSFSRLPYVGCDYDATEEEGRITQTNSFTFRYQDVVRNKYWFDWEFIQQSLKQNDESLVSVIIYYGKNDSVSSLRNCLTSLKNAIACGHSKYRTEVIVADDSCSEEKTAALSKFYDESLIDRYLVNRSECRFPLSCNRALSVANGYFVVYLDANSYVSANWLDAIIEPLKKHPRLYGTTSKVLLQNGAVNSMGCLFDSSSGLPYDVLCGMPSDFPASERLSLLPAVNSFCCAFRTADVSARKGLYCIYETELAVADLCLQLADGQALFACISDSSVICPQHVHQSSVLANDFEAFAERWHGKDVYEEQKFFARRNVNKFIKFREKVCTVGFKKYSRTGYTRSYADFMVPVYDVSKLELENLISRTNASACISKGQDMTVAGETVRKLA